MKRSDYELPFLLQYENIAWYEDGIVKILDRRIYPAKKEFVVCSNHKEVTKAITDMVTQSGGPFTAAGMGMALAAFECRNKTKEEQKEYLKNAAFTISNARPTTQKRMEEICNSCLESAYKALDDGKNDIDIEVRDHTIHLNNKRYDKVEKIASYLVKEFNDNGNVMTQCFGETIVGMMLRECKKQNKKVKLFCPETRPYFQGARLTASVCQDMGFDTTVITDNMPAFVMANEGIDIFTCAADAICMDGYVVNKVGTSQISIVAKHFNVPVYVTGGPDYVHKSIESIKIEMRNPDDSLYAMGVRTAKDGVKGYYPAFDITPPELITGIVTDRGILKPTELDKYYIGYEKEKYEVTV